MYRIYRNVKVLVNLEPFMNKKLKKVSQCLFSEKKSHRAENTLREYPLAPLSFLDDVKILLRKLSKNCKNCKIVRFVKKSGPFREIVG